MFEATHTTGWAVNHCQTGQYIRSSRPPTPSYGGELPHYLPHYPTLNSNL